MDRAARGRDTGSAAPVRHVHAVGGALAAIGISGVAAGGADRRGQRALPGADPVDDDRAGNRQHRRCRNGSDVAAVADRFKTWITQPQRSAARSKPYPVFIIAVEGGGIYAATAASLFLAKLQDANPDFAQHVFAISAVSGGAIGATIFQALAAAAAGAPPHKGVASASDGCAGRGGSVRMQGARHP